MIQYDSNEEAVLVGVVSRGIGCGEALRPGIYARVAAFEEFLDSLVKYEKAVETRAVFSDVNKDANPLKIILIVTCVGMGVVVLLGGILVWYVWAHKGDGDGSRDGNEGNGEDAGSEAVVNEDRARKEGGEVGIRGLEEGQ